MKTPILDTGLFDRPCEKRFCPSLADLEKYAKGKYVLLDEDIFNLIEDCLFQDECQFCLTFVKEMEPPQG